MRIYDRDLSGTAAAETGRAQETQKSDREASVSSSTPETGASDRVELSSGLASVARALSAFHSDRTQKVQQLATQFQAGNYVPNSLATSQGIVAAALGSAVS